MTNDVELVEPTNFLDCPDRDLSLRGALRYDWRLMLIEVGPGRYRITNCCGYQDQVLAVGSRIAPYLRALGAREWFNKRTQTKGIWIGSTEPDERGECDGWWVCARCGDEDEWIVPSFGYIRTIKPPQ